MDSKVILNKNFYKTIFFFTLVFSFVEAKKINGSVNSRDKFLGKEKQNLREFQRGVYLKNDIENQGINVWILNLK